MAKKEYGWDGSNVPVIGEHSLAKHRILREYVERYIEILTTNPRIERLNLALVDGFAGGGIYQRKGHRELHFGSPAILIEAVAAAQLRVNQTRRKPVAIQPMTTLCREGDFIKRGERGQCRHAETAVRDDDVILPAKQLRLWRTP